MHVLLEPHPEAAELKVGAAVIPQTFSDFVPGAKAHAIATFSDEDKENVQSKATAFMDDAATDAQVKLVVPSATPR